METKQFPNGFASWMETHHEVVAKLTLQVVKDVIESPVVLDRYESQGTGGIYGLAEELTDEFERINEGRQWDGEFFDEIDEFVSNKLFPAP